MSVMDPVVRRPSDGGGGRRRPDRGHYLVIGSSIFMALTVLHRWAQHMRRLGGSSSDDDRDKRTLRERENAAPQRDDTDDRLILSPILLQHGLPIELLASHVQIRVNVRLPSGATNNANLMTAIRLVRMNGREIRAAIGTFSRARLMLVMTMIKSFAGDGGRQRMHGGRGGARAVFWPRGHGGGQPIDGGMGRMRSMMMTVIMMLR